MPPTQQVYSWLAVTGVLLVVLYKKGYFDRFVAKTDTTVYSPPLATMAPVKETGKNDCVSGPLENLDARTLGLAFARASKREGEEAFLNLMAEHLHQQNKAVFAAPFVVPAVQAPVTAGNP